VVLAGGVPISQGYAFVTIPWVDSGIYQGVRKCFSFLFADRSRIDLLQSSGILVTSVPILVSPHPILSFYVLDMPRTFTDCF
jgi:hypothetical protein